MVKGSTEKVSGPAVHEGLGARSDLKFKGVRKRKWGKWVSEVRLPNSRQRIWLGSYDTPEKAARAFDAAVFCLRGRATTFNFPDSPPEIPGAGSLTLRQIQEAAASFAHSGAMLAQAERSGSVPPAPSPSLSVSEASSILTIDESELAMDLLFLDGEPDFGLFPGVEEFPSHLYGKQLLVVGNQELNIDEFLTQDNFFWGF